MGADMFMHPATKDEFALLYNDRHCGLYRWQADRIWPHADQDNWILLEYTDLDIAKVKRFLKAAGVRVARCRSSFIPKEWDRVPRDTMRVMLHGE